ncbi:hypothetical protein T261_7646 [Streptomyces lydicus]|nr:hypothetical protein T261_7646 [Streptomyces lydicus]
MGFRRGKPCRSHVSPAVAESEANGLGLPLRRALPAYGGGTAPARRAGAVRLTGPVTCSGHLLRSPAPVAQKGDLALESLRSRRPPAAGAHSL